MPDLLPFEELKRDLLIRKSATSDSKFGLDPSLRPTAELIECGLVILNKSQGPTSHQVSAYAQQVLGISRAGHSGTLDPNVTGVLPVALSKATRIVSALLNAGKEYVGIMRLHKSIPEEKVMGGIESFVGKINQLPPVRSSVKRQIRERNIYYFKVLEHTERDYLFKVGCQAGTYIRKLVHDLGEKLGTGAHMQQLIRTKAGPFTIGESWTLNEVRDAMWYYKNESNDKYLRRILRPIESGVSHLPKIYVLDSTVGTLCHGADLGAPGVCQFDSHIEVGDLVAIMTLKKELIGLGNAAMSSAQLLIQEKGLAAKTHTIFMDPGVYPKIKMV